MVFFPWGSNFKCKDQWEEEEGSPFDNLVNWERNEKEWPSDEDSQSVGNVVGPDHREEAMALFTFPVVVRSGLGERVVKFWLIELFEISIVESIGGKSYEEVEWEENGEPKGRSDGGSFFEQEELHVSLENLSIVVINVHSVPDPDEFIQTSEGIVISA